MMKLAGMACLELKQEHPEWDMKILASIHDEFLFSCKKEYADEVAKQIKHAFEHCVKLIVGVESSVSTGSNYSECK